MSQTALGLEAEWDAVIATCRQVHAEAAAATRRARALRAELADLLQCRTISMPGVLSRPLVEHTVQSCAEDVIDTHGRWARHVAVKCAAIRACREDVRGELFWQGVLAAIVDMQTRPLQ